jgi:hypothetical protein
MCALLVPFVAKFFHLEVDFLAFFASMTNQSSCALIEHSSPLYKTCLVEDCFILFHSVLQNDRDAKGKKAHEIKTFISG